MLHAMPTHMFAMLSTLQFALLAGLPTKMPTIMLPSSMLPTTLSPKVLLTMLFTEMLPT